MRNRPAPIRSATPAATVLILLCTLGSVGCGSTARDGVRVPGDGDSDALDYDLVAGKRYAVGVHADGATRVYYRNSSVYLPDVAFARAPAAYWAAAPDQPDVSEALASSTTKYYLRYTTGLTD